mmetsp:Transcript_21276/g.39881  ORF Transcript_21276/g.39881 Transcript_21276/m.39881 type:complete len:246 (-) Transcript_21276:52-789(-)
MKSFNASIGMGALEATRLSCCRSFEDIGLLMSGSLAFSRSQFNDISRLFLCRSRARVAASCLKPIVVSCANKSSLGSNGRDCALARLSPNFRRKSLISWNCVSCDPCELFISEDPDRTLCFSDFCVAAEAVFCCFDVGFELSFSERLRFLGFRYIRTKKSLEWKSGKSFRSGLCSKSPLSSIPRNTSEILDAGKPICFASCILTTSAVTCLAEALKSSKNVASVRVTIRSCIFRAQNVPPSPRKP